MREQESIEGGWSVLKMLSRSRVQTCLVFALAVVVAIPALVASAPAPRRGGTLRFAQTADFINLRPWPDFESKHVYVHALFDTLLQLSPERRPQPRLAESWDMSPDQKHMTLRLRRGVKFHNGREFVADDVVWNIEWIKLPATRAQISFAALNIAATAVDAHTVRLDFTRIPSDVWDMLDTMPILAKESEPNADLNPTGTGPFKVAEAVPGQRLRLVRNPDYWDAGLPYLDAIEVQIIPDAVSIISNLESGSVDMVRSVQPSEIERLKRKGKTVILSGNYLGIYNIAINTARPPFDNKLVRQAINAALDRDRMVRLGLAGTVKPHCEPFSPQSPAFIKELNTCPFDLAKAKRLLAQAGLANGFQTTITTSSSYSRPFLVIATVLQSDLAKIGVKAMIEDVEAARWFQYNQRADYAGLNTHSYFSAALAPFYLFATRPWNPRGNIANFRSDEYTRLVEMASNEPNEQRLRQIYRQLTQYMLDQAWVLPIAPLVQNWAAQPSVHGYEYAFQNYEVFNRAWVER